MKSRKMNLTIAVAILLTFCAQGFAQTNGASVANLKNQNGVGQEAQAIVATVLKKTYISSGAPNLFVPAGTYTTLDSGTTVTCPGPGTCTLLVDAWATSGGTVTAGNERALILIVDGEHGGFGGYLGEDAADGTYSSMTDLDAPATITAGKHTVSIQAYSRFSTTIAYYRTIYRVYKPEFRANRKLRTPICRHQKWEELALFLFFTFSLPHF
jgi:hypothetical protein